MIQGYIDKHIEISNLLKSNKRLLDSCSKVVDLLFSTISQNKKILIAGNGGSAADAQHFAAEIIGRFLKERKGYPAVALTTDTSILTAVGNDYGFENIFSRQIEALASSGDCFIAFSTSGNSENILYALKKAREMGVDTVLLAGKDGGAAKELADFSIIIPAEETSHIQEMHQILYHAWCAELDNRLKI